MSELKVTKLLDKLSFPDALKDLTDDELAILSEEIRIRLIEIGDQCGGHLASNLGVVELTVVLHTLFSSPIDKLVWDTSHQTYIHKMLTGRLDKMLTIRQENGLSGFANIFESEHDTFGAGHASTALSAALGLAHARDIQKQEHCVISIIGDSSLSGGMAFEALNNFERLKSNFICILNDNNMSISNPVGNMSTYMTKIRTSPVYDQARKLFDQILGTIPQSGPLKRKIDKGLDRVRDIIIDQKAGVIFEEFGFQYLGPIDGHNIPMLMAALKYAKSYNGPILIHAVTQKGRGHIPAENDPIKYHGVSPKKSASPPPKEKPITNSEFFGSVMMEICEQKDDVVVITPAMIGGSGLTAFSRKYPEKLYDVGIAEEHAVTFAAGLARGGITPVLAIYSTFLQRGYDQLIHDVCIQKLPVIFCLDRAGFAGEDGATHHGVFDIAYMLPIPEITILAPKDANEIKSMINWSVNQQKPISIRYPKGKIILRDDLPLDQSPPNVPEIMYKTKSNTIDICILAIGSMSWEAYDAACMVEKKGINVMVVNLKSVKPLNKEFLDPLIKQSNHILVIEEGSAISGAFSFIQKEFNYIEKKSNQWNQLAIPDRFFDHAKIDSLRQQCSLNSVSISNYILDKIKNIISV